MKQTIIVFWLLILALTCAAQKDNDANKNIPDLSGTWILDKKKSGPETGFMSEMYVDITLVIVHTEPEVKITRTTKTPDGKELVENIVYYTDGRRTGVKGKIDEDNYPTVEWKGKKLVKKDKYVIKKGEGLDWFVEKSGLKEVKLNNREIWELSKDGQTLTNTASGGNLASTAPSITTPDGQTRDFTPSAFKYVFRRQP